MDIRRLESTYNECERLIWKALCCDLSCATISKARRGAQPYFNFTSTQRTHIIQFIILHDDDDDDDDVDDNDSGFVADRKQFFEREYHPMLGGILFRLCVYFRRRKNISLVGYIAIPVSTMSVCLYWLIAQCIWTKPVGAQWLTHKLQKLIHCKAFLNFPHLQYFFFFSSLRSIFWKYIPSSFLKLGCSV